MHYHLSNHIYITQFRDELILLDTKRDKYTICLKEFSQLLMGLLGNNTLSSKGSSGKIQQDLSSNDISQVSRTVQKLLDNGILEKKEIPYPYYIDRKPYSEGVANVDWRLPLENEKVGISIHVIKALFTLIRINSSIKFRGLHQTIQLLKKYRDSKAIYIIPQDLELKNLANIVNKACLLYPTRTKCLEWAMTYVLMALDRKWKCNLEIGVQNYPFFAHAWVECDGKVIMDAQDLREGLSIILNEPFRRTDK